MPRAATTSHQGLTFFSDWGTPAGVFLDGRRIAWVPAGVSIDQHRASVILVAWQSLGRTLSRKETAELFDSLDG